MRGRCWEIWQCTLFKPSYAVYYSLATQYIIASLQFRSKHVHVAAWRMHMYMYEDADDVVVSCVCMWSWPWTFSCNHKGQEVEFNR